ncbi:unnamed protein product [Citrullus colocynthis]|uniref:Uncharacterized protein n=1 Tax=Citrullus colocynthis TaxID=252529 RepID=A0ABP0YUS7_9ROSI
MVSGKRSSTFSANVVPFVSGLQSHPLRLSWSLASTSIVLHWWSSTLPFVGILGYIVLFIVGHYYWWLLFAICQLVCGKDTTAGTLRLHSSTCCPCVFVRFALERHDAPNGSTPISVSVTALHFSASTLA